MELIAAIIVGLLGFGVYQYQAKKKAQQDAKLGEARGQDAELKITQDDLNRMIGEIDQGIEDMKKAREAEKAKKDSMTLKERRDALRKKYKR